MAARSRKTAPKAKARAKPRGAKAPAALARWREGSDQLEALAKATSEALVGGSVAGARQAFGDYQALLLQHLTREEDFVFPAAEKRAPAQGGPIKSLRVAHIGIRKDLARIGAHLELGHAEAARAVFGAFLESFAAHERLEDQLEALLGKSPAGTGPRRRSG